MLQTLEEVRHTLFRTPVQAKFPQTWQLSKQGQQCILGLLRVSSKENVQVLHSCSMSTEPLRDLHQGQQHQQQLGVLFQRM